MSRPIEQSTNWKNHQRLKKGSYHKNISVDTLCPESYKKNLETIWQELTEEFREDLQWLNFMKDSIWNTVRDHEINHPLTQAESKLTLEDQDKETVSETRFWRLRPDVIVFRPSTETKTGIFCILRIQKDEWCYRPIPHPGQVPKREPICMSSKDSRGSLTSWVDSDQSHRGIPLPYWRRSPKKPWIFPGPGDDHWGHRVKKISEKTLNFSRSRRRPLRSSGQDMKIFDEYSNILRYMYSTRFRGGSSGTGSSTEGPQIPETSVPSLIRCLESGHTDNFRRRTSGRKEGRDT